MKRAVTIWWLKTHDNIDVYSDGKGHYSLEVLPKFAAVELRDGEYSEDELEISAEKISQRLGIRCRWVRGQVIC
jgi:hypothetical protein